MAYRLAAAAATVLLAGVAVPEAMGASLRFEPVADAYVTGAKRNGNFGRSRSLLVEGAPVVRSYLRFNVQGIPSQITNATLELSARGVSARGVVVRRSAAKSWNERSIRFTNAPRVLASPAATMRSIRSRGAIRINVTALIRGNGMVTLVLVGRGRNALAFASREAGAALRPRLSVTSNAVPLCLDGTTMTVVEDVPGAKAASCTDGDKDALTYEIVDQGSKGTASVAGGELRYVPKPNANGADRFMYRAKDSTSASEPVGVTVAIRAMNDVPTCASAAVTTAEDTTVDADTACNDADGEALTYSIAAQGSKGSVSAAGATLRYRPNANANGVDSFAYRANDGSSLSAPATVTVTITPVDDAPTCSARTIALVEDGAGEVEPLCADVEGQPLTYSMVLQGTKGSASLASGKLRYVANPNANGTDAFTYRASDGSGFSVPATVSVTIQAVNDAPTCAAATLAVTEDSPAERDPVCGDVDGDTLTYAVVAQGGKGIASVVGTKLRYTPNANVSGGDSFTYTASDGTATSSPVAVSVTISAANDPPVCSNGTLVLAEDGQAELTPGCTDAEGSTLTYSVVTQGLKGSASVVSGKLRYTANPNANGADSFIYRASDGAASSANTTVSVTINPVNDAPTCLPLSVTTAEDTVAERDPACTDVDGDALTYSIARHGSKGTASVVGGKLRYAPNANAAGGDSFAYAASDASAGSGPATVTVTITGANDAPVCAARTLTLDEDSEGAVATACTDADGDTLTYSLASQPTAGVAFVDAGELHYVPFANAHGADSFSYEAADATSSSAPASVSVTVRAVNDEPEAVPQELTTDSGVSKTVTLDGFDEDGDALTFVVKSLPANGRLHVGSNAAGHRILATELPYHLPGAGTRVTYVPNSGFGGHDAFEFSAADGAAEGLPAEIRLTVRGVNVAPVCSNKTLSVEEDGELWDQACTDANGDALTFTRTGPSHGSLTIFDDGAFNYVPHADYAGPDSFTVQATDADGLQSAVATVSITVTPVNDAPVCATTPITTLEDTVATTFPDCEDPDGDPLQYTIVAQATKGVASATPDGRLRYAPDADDNGADTFSFRASDGSLESAVTDAPVQITAVNDRPTCQARTLSTTVGVAASVAPLCEDVDNDSLVIQIVTQSSHGTASSPGGQLRYAPATGYSGPDSFTYRASDGSLVSTPVTVTVTVT